jgi:ferredoxin--NADP+ reductase
MMTTYPIVKKHRIAPDIFQYEVSAPLIAKKFKAGQFIVLRPFADSERVPLTIKRANKDSGTITLIVKAIGLSTKQLALLNEGDAIADVLGPLGHPSEIGKFGRVVVVGGGVGTAVAFAVAEALKQAGNTIISIIGARSKDFTILEQEFAAISDELFVMTDDGSYKKKGFVTQQLQELYDAGTHIDRVIAAGPLPMMRAVVEMTRPHATPTIVSLNPIMIDGIGMCGGCRALVDGKIVFVCVDGPEFDGHKVDFDSLMRRNDAYRDIEREKEHACKIDEQLDRDAPQ